MSARKLVYVTTSLGYGGASTQLVQVCLRLRSRGWDTSVVTMTDPRAHTKLLAGAGVQVTSLRMHPGVPDPRGLVRVAGYLRSKSPTIVHSHMVHANLLTRAARPLHRRPVLICTSHSTNEGGLPLRLAYMLTDRLCDLTTVVSNAVAEKHIQAKTVSPAKLRIVPNGIDTAVYSPRRDVRDRMRRELGVEQRFVWLAVGRLEQPKDYPSLLRAFQLVSRQRSEAILLIAGNGSLHRTLEAQASKLQIADRTTFLGARDDVGELMRASDALVMSSLWEGLPMALLEASAVELPIVATDVGGNREVVEDGITGILASPGKPESLAAGMLRMMADPPERRQSMGRRGRRRTQTVYSLENVVDMWEEVYLSLMRTRGR